MSEQQYPDSWAPDEGDRLIGKVVDKRTANTKYGERPVVEVEEDDGTRYTVWAGSTVLRRDLYEACSVGDTVDIAYEGKRTSQAGNEYNSYNVEIG